MTNDNKNILKFRKKALKALKKWKKEEPCGEKDTLFNRELWELSQPYNIYEFIVGRRI